MRKLLGSLAVVALLAGGIGLWRGWFRISQQNQPAETNVTVTIHKERIRHDARLAMEKIGLASERAESQFDANGGRRGSLLRRPVIRRGWAEGSR